MNYLENQAKIEELMSKHWEYYFNEMCKDLHNMGILVSEQLSEINPICKIYNNCFEIVLPQSEHWNRKKYFVFVEEIDFEKFCEEQYFKIPNELKLKVDYIENIKDGDLPYLDPKTNIKKVYSNNHHSHELLEKLIEKRISEVIDEAVTIASYQTNEAVKYDFDGSGEWQ
ncbi:MAG: hypothetical protein ACTTKR_01115 [Dialister pneumosintes]